MKKIYLLFLSIITSFSLLVNIKNISNLNTWKYIYNTNIFFVTLISLLLFIFYQKYYNVKKPIFFKLLASIFSLFIIIGYSFATNNSLSLITKSFTHIIAFIIQFFSFYHLFTILVTLFFNSIKTFNVEFKGKIKKYIIYIFDKKSYIMPFIIILISWLPFLIAYYPGILTSDCYHEIKEVLGYDDYLITYAKKIDPEATITNHHPVIHTLLIGNAVKFGESINNVNLGIFIFTFIQMMIMIAIFSYSLHYLKRIKTPYYLRVIILILYCLCPIFPFYGINIVKDSLYSAFILLYTIMLFDSVKNINQKYNYKKIIIWILVILLILLFRNNGIHVLLLSFPLLFIIDKRNIKALLLILLIPLIIYAGYKKVIFPMYHIVEGSKREMLSIPFQQTARYVKYYEKDLSEKDKAIIDKILIYETLSTRYKPELSDPVKAKFNEYATDAELKEYFELWFKGLLKRPITYLSATLNNTYAYFYPNSAKWYLYNTYLDPKTHDFELDYYYNNLTAYREKISLYGTSFKDIPILGLTVNVAVYTWVILSLTVFILQDKKYKYLIYLSPILVSVLICFAGPLNGSIRYALPYMYATPIAIAFYIHVSNENRKKEKK